MKKMDKALSIFIKLIMFVSSCFPLYVIFIILYAKRIMTGFYEKNIVWIISFIALLILIAISFGSLILLKNGSGNRKKSVENLERPDNTVLSYIIIYIIPLLTYGNSSMEVYIVNILLLILIGYIYLRLNLIHLNPLWVIFGYIVYRDSNKNIIITNLSRESLRHKKVLYGYYLSNGIFVAHKKDNQEI